MKLCLVLLLAVALCHGTPSTRKFAQGHRADAGPSNTPVGTSAPNLPGGTIANDAPPGPFFQDFTPPFPTDAWWSGFTVGNQDAVVAGPFPFQSVTTLTGLRFGMADSRRFDGTSIHVDTQLDFTVGFTGLPENIRNRKATEWDTQAVCLKYFNDASTTTMDSCLVPGSPYISVKFTNAEVVITSNQGDIQQLTWVEQGKKAKITHAGGTYILYVLGGDLQLRQDGNLRLVSQAGFSGTLRFAKLKEASQEAILDTHSTIVPRGVNVAYQVNGDISTQTWTWIVSEGNAADLLLLSWPHHRRALQNPNNVAINYLTLKGQMRGVRGNVWTQRHELPNISWFSRNAPHASCASELRKTLEAEVNNLEVMVPGDFYFWGGAWAAKSRLALIAEHLGGAESQEIINKVVAILKQSAEYWFDGNRSPSAAFETGWGGFINKDGWNNTWVDFGNAYYNDHHFHYGYLLHGAAVIGKYDPAWLQQHMEFFMHVARNTGNPSPNDPHYAVVRHFDWFAGHSWASGIANGAGPRDQSSGEAINGYYGLLLFAHAVNNQPLIDFARLVLAMEIAGAREYWHLYPNTQDADNAYPEQEFRDLTTVGNVMDTQAGAWLFWGGQRIQIAAIQILPLTPIGYYTYDKEWIEGVIPYCQEELDDVTLGDDFKSVIYASYAKVDPSKAYEYSSNLFSWGTGNSASNQLYFVSTQDPVGGRDICTAAAQTPEGIYNVQDITTGEYLTVNSNGHLVATTTADVLAEKFELGFTPGGGTIKSSSLGKYVTASPDGTSALTAARDTAQSYETFRWTQTDGTYTLTAMVNRAFVVTQPNGELLNNANATNGITASRYRLTQTDTTNPTPIPANGKLRSKENNLHVVADPVLKATANNAGDATTFAFERVEGSPDGAPVHVIKSTANNMYVTGNMDGTVTLAATAGVPQAWEHFRIVGYQGGYIVIHVVSGKAVKLQADGTLIDNTTSIDNTTIWEIV